MVARRTTRRKRRITQEQMIKYLGKERQIFFPLTKKSAYKYRFTMSPDLDLYFPFSLEQTADQLERQGFVEKILTKEGLVVKIRERGKIQILNYNLSDLKPPEPKWDGRWWLVFFDIDKKHSRVRDKLRGYLRQIGMEMFQESVFISPYDVTDQVKYLREILEIPNSIKIARLDLVENEDDLKEIFELK